MKKKNKKYGWCIIIYGFSGSGKSGISRKIKKDIEKMIGTSILLDGDDLRTFFKKIGISFGFSKKERDRSVVPKLEILNLILKRNINVIYPTIFLNKLAINKWSKNIDNLIKIYIKTSVKDIINFGKKKDFYLKKKNIVGKDIKPYFPKAPHVIIENDFKKSIDKLAVDVTRKLKNKLIR
tara:strand:+ start:72 stop:611 length:540 start_codon:yes stop_codon:yes gene_type:complete